MKIFSPYFTFYNEGHSLRYTGTQDRVIHREVRVVLGEDDVNFTYDNHLFEMRVWDRVEKIVNEEFVFTFQVLDNWELLLKVVLPFYRSSFGNSSIRTSFMY